MKNLKSLFGFSKEQRKGIFLLLIIVVILQVVIWKLNSSSEESQVANESIEVISARKEIEQLRLKQRKKDTFKISPFNPNYISDYKGYVLGMSTQQIDALHHYREKGRWVNSVKEFKMVTGVSDSLLNKIAPYFKFPVRIKPKKVYSKKKPLYKRDLNTATISDLKQVYGIGNVLAQRILDYREKHNGFVSIVELTEIYGLTPERITELKKHFNVIAINKIVKIDLNTASSDDLVTVKYIDYELAYQIIEYRKLHNGFRSLEELLKVKDFPLEKYHIIQLYLHVN